MQLRASYWRTSGMRHMIAGLDLATGQIFYRIRFRKRWREFLAFLKLLRQRWPAGRLYVIADNFSPHKHPQVTSWAAGHDVELVFLPIYSSWLNWIEPEFAALRYFALNGTDHRTRAEQGDAIARYLLAQCPRQAQTRLRLRFSDPHLDQLPEQGCLTRH
jgi:transposase